MKILPKKSLGQNFLIDSKILNIITDLGEISQSDIVLEVGPGSGNLTKNILKKNPKKLVVIEKDKNLSELLKKKFKDSIEIVNDDILNYNQDHYYNKKIIIFGNLPYNISTQILISWIKLNNLHNFCKKFILMFQKEVADRIISKYNSKNYGRLTVLTNWKLNVKKILDIKPSCFSPRPKIDSSVLFFEPKKNFYKLNNSKSLEKITRIFFMHRRKMIKKPYNQLFNGNTHISSTHKIDLNLRPQNLDCDTYFKLANEYEKLIG